MPRFDFDKEMELQMAISKSRKNKKDEERKEFREDIKQALEEDRMVCSLSDSVDIKTQRMLLDMTKINSILTYEETSRILAVYNEAISRVFKENNVKE